MIRCGHCKEKHLKVEHVWMCSRLDEWELLEQERQAEEAADAEARWERAIEEREYHLAYAHLDYDGPDVW